MQGTDPHRSARGRPGQPGVGGDGRAVVQRSDVRREPPEGRPTGGGDGGHRLATRLAGEDLVHQLDEDGRRRPGEVGELK